MAKKLTLAEKINALIALCDEYDVPEALRSARDKVVEGHVAHGNDAHEIDLPFEIGREFLDVLGYCAIARCRNEWSGMFTCMMTAASNGLRAVEEEMENRVSEQSESEASHNE